MSRLLALLLLFVTALPAFAQERGASLAKAMQSMREGNWAAARIAARGDGQAAVDVILWHALRAGRGDAREVQDFLSRHPDWPGLPYLREKSEPTMSEASLDEIRAFFADALPQTGSGALSLAKAHMAQGNEGAAQADIVLAWRTLSMTSDERRAFLTTWGEILRDHHEARLDMALWQGWSRDAGQMMGLVDEGWQALAQARLALRSSAPGVDTLIAKVPEELSDHPGLAYERFLWRVRKRRTEDAIELLRAQSVSPAGLGEPWAWAPERIDLARERMRAGAYAEAYEIAARHWLVEGTEFAELEWIAGFIALRFLDRADLAVMHFENFREGVWTPISVGRGGYWLGRAYEAAGEAEKAKEAYAIGAEYQTSFYGLLAAERAGLPPDPTLAGNEAFPDWRQADFTKSSVFEAAVLLLAAGETNLGERFLTHLAESLDREGMGRMGMMLMEMNRPHIQVMLGKRAAQFGIQLPGPYYALDPQVTEGEYPVPKELVLSIARRESEFDPGVISGAGARGYMQLMPGTAKLVSGQLGLEYDLDRLLTDPGYNAKLGSRYLAGLSERFDGNAVMMAAGYNAGPGRPIGWMERFGDPRKGDIDIIDWIEMIPFDETRNYVMRVTESLPVYRARLGKPPHPVPFSQELVGGTLKAVLD
ncbi:MULTISPECIES: lytic transglycosylase domain-containing protein [Mameliella]|uniref:lytic transglycosylase domain-containing protein n=1 Tax=Mameliella TaxID=1434019 RepID=UPI000B53037E|nr:MULTISPECIES: lytic transglycosylase domain-containing protein [Mameliella]MCR9274114.1 lytic transglycosylase domain-containing protein [Paracoccaceae bacterium]OWV59045.1 tail length tape measure protein [Mameliella alba]